MISVSEILRQSIIGQGWGVWHPVNTLAVARGEVGEYDRIAMGEPLILGSEMKRIKERAPVELSPETSSFVQCVGLTQRRGVHRLMHK
jgi:hypothetical protein